MPAACFALSLLTAPLSAAAPAADPPVAPIAVDSSTGGDQDMSPQPKVPEASEVVPLVVAAVAALQRKDFVLLTSLAVMLLVFALDMLWLRRQPDDKRKRLLPWTSVVFGVLLQFAAALAAHRSWLDALNMAFVTGAAASGLWDLVGKQIIGRLAPKEAAANPSRQTTAVPPPSATIVKPS